MLWNGVIRTPRFIAQRCRNRSDRGGAQGVCRERAADPADVRIVDVNQAAESVRDVPGHPVGSRGDPAADRLADDEHVGLETVAAGHPTRTGADRVGLVDDQQRAGSFGDLAHGREVARLGQDDPDVREGRFDEDGRDLLVGQRPLEIGDVVEVDDAGGERRIDGRPDRAPARDHPAVRGTRCERLVDRAVIAVIVDDDLRPVRQVAGKPDREAVRVRRGDGELPEWEAEPTGELLAGRDRVVRREHVGDAALELALDGGDRRRGPVAGHRPGVAEAEVDVVVAVDAADVRPAGLVDERRPGAGPSDHPVHRDAVDQ